MTIDLSLWKQVETSKQLEEILENQGINKDILIFFSKINCPGCEGVKNFLSTGNGLSYIRMEDVLPIIIEKKGTHQIGDFTQIGYEVIQFPHVEILDGRNNFNSLGKGNLPPLIHTLIDQRYFQLK